MATSNYKIIAQVELDTKGIQKQLDSIGKTFAKSGIGNSGKELAINYQEANMILRQSVEVIGNMIDQVYELDGAITEFKKVSDLQGSSLERYVDRLSEMGQSVGRTASEMVEAATMFRKNSFNDQDSAQLAKVASMYQNVSDTAISAGDAASFIISQMKAFNIAAEDAGSIIDKVNETANNYSVGTNDLSNALELSASGMQTYNNTIEQTIGLTIRSSKNRLIDWKTLRAYSTKQIKVMRFVA